MPFAYRTKLPRGGSSQWVSGGAAPVLNAEFFGVAAPPPATAIEVFQLAPIVEVFGNTITTPFPSDLTAGNDVWAMVQIPTVDAAPASVRVQGVDGTLVFTDTRDVVTGAFVYRFYVWRNVAAGPGSLVVQKSPGGTVNCFALETTPGGTLGQMFYTNANEFAVPLPDSPNGSLAFAALRSDGSTDLIGTAPTVATGASGDWNYGLYEEMATGAGNTLQWSKSAGTYRGIVGIVVEPPPSGPAVHAGVTVQPAATLGPIVAPPPAGTTAGNLLIAVVRGYITARGITPPAGWTLVGTEEIAFGDLSQSVYWAPGSVTNFTWNEGASPSSSVVIEVHRITGADLTNPVRAFAYRDSETDPGFDNTQANMPTPSVTAVAGDCILSTYWQPQSDSAIGATPSGYDLVVNESVPNRKSTIVRSNAPAGATGELSFAASAAFQARVGFTMAIRAAGGAAPSAALNYWNGTAFVPGVLKRWNGAAWVTHTLKRWNGSAWI